VKELTKIEEILLLSIWRLEDHAYGFKIRHHISDMIGRDFTYGNLYSSLNQLVKKKYVVKHQGESTPARRGKVRMYYTLSDSGRQALKEAFEMNLILWSGVHRYAFDTENK
jgi:PadR family transcriptional regulator PadR